MRVLDSSPTRLTLEDRPMLLGIILAVVIVFLLFLAIATLGESLWVAFAVILMAALFAGAFVIFVRRVNVVLDRDTDTVVILTSSLLGKTETTHALGQVSRASVETSISRSTSSGGRRGTTSRTHRTVLHIGAETVPLTQIYSGGDGAERAATAINTWLGQ